ncbi:MAG: alkaline phosphatase family protein [Proteobacteria bacterium]|nr:alkaline phosphatase family protein [Pseudomonadota bacterium]
MNNHRESNKVIVIGLDGATFDLLLPWINEGILPVMANLLKQGAWGGLESTIPPLTPPAWASFITGKNPGKHGIFDFRGPVNDNLERLLISSRSIRSRKLWEIVNAHKRRVGIINIPVTYPPEEVDGFMISGMLTPNNKVCFTHPPDLKDRLIAKIGDYVIDVDSGLYDPERTSEVKRFFNDLKYAFIKRKEALFFLMEDEPWDFLAVNFIEHDRIQHLFWKYLDKRSALYYLDKAKNIRSTAIELYQMVDEMIGTIIGKMDKKTSLFIMSDHGFGPHHYSLNINGWLANLGLLHTKNEGSKMRQWVKALMPVGIRRRLRKMVIKRVPIGERKEGEDIDFRSSKAYFGGASVQGIYLRVEGDEYLKIRELIKDGLLKFKDPHTGEKLVDQVFFKEEVYWGSNLSSAPDILFIAKGYSIPGSSSTYRENLISSRENSPLGFHHRNGILIASGKNFKKGYRLEEAAIIDLAPTILYRMEIPVPSDMDGKVLKEIFDDDYIHDHPVAYSQASNEIDQGAEKVYSQDEQLAVEKRLRGLGYID